MFRRHLDPPWVRAPCRPERSRLRRSVCAPLTVAGSHRYRRRARNRRTLVRRPAGAQASNVRSPGIDRRQVADTNPHATDCSGQRQIRVDPRRSSAQFAGQPAAETTVIHGLSYAGAETKDRCGLTLAMPAQRPVGTSGYHAGFDDLASGFTSRNPGGAEGTRTPDPHTIRRYGARVPTEHIARIERSVARGFPVCFGP